MFPDMVLFISLSTISFDTFSIDFCMHMPYFSEFIRIRKDILIIFVDNFVEIKNSFLDMFDSFFEIDTFSPAGDRICL